MKAARRLQAKERWVRLRWVLVTGTWHEQAELAPVTSDVLAVNSSSGTPMRVRPSLPFEPTIARPVIEAIDISHGGNIRVVQAMEQLAINQPWRVKEAAE